MKKSTKHLPRESLGDSYNSVRGCDRFQRVDRLSDQKSDNLQYDTLSCWVDRLIDQASDGPSIILID